MNPYTGSYQHELTGQCLLNAIRLDILKEHDAVIFYEVHRRSITDNRVIKILDEIIKDEKQHIVLLTHLLELLDTNRELEAVAGATDEIIQLELE